jgi:hypothetical protein
VARYRDDRSVSYSGDACHLPAPAHTGSQAGVGPPARGAVASCRAEAPATDRWPKARAQQERKVARRCRKVGAPRSATASPPPGASASSLSFAPRPEWIGNPVASLVSTSAAGFPHPANPRSLSVDCTQYRGRADDSDPAQLVALCWKCDRSWRRNFGSCCKPPPFSLSIPSFGTPQAGSDKRAGSPARGDTRQTPDARAGSAGLSRGRVTHQTRAAPRRLPSPRFWAQPFPSY